MEGIERRPADPPHRAHGGGTAGRRRPRDRFGEYSAQRSSSGCRLPNYDPDGSSNTDSYENETASSDEENVSRKKKMLEDALFGFFKKEAIKSLKRDFSTFCKKSNFLTENKRPKVNSVGREVFSVYSTKYFAEILRGMTIHQKGVVTRYDYECLLKFEKTEIPSRFIQWIAGYVDPVSSQIIVTDEKIISLSKDSVSHVLGLPNCGSVAIQDSDGGSALILSRFKLSEMPHITFFGNLLKSADPMSDDDTFICFMVIAMSCFIFPSADQNVHTSYMSLLEDPMAASGFDMCLLVHEWIIDGINKFVISGKANGRKPKVFEFCTYCLAVLYLDNLDFGARVVENTVPRVLVWKGNLVKYFSELDRKRKSMYGRRQFKKNFARSFKEDLCATKANTLECNIRLRPVSEHFKQDMRAEFSKTLPSHIVDDIINITQPGQHDQTGIYKDTEAIVHNVLRFLSAANTRASKPNLQARNGAKHGVHVPNIVIDKLIQDKNDGQIESSKGKTTRKDVDGERSVGAHQDSREPGWGTNSTLIFSFFLQSSVLDLYALLIYYFSLFLFVFYAVTPDCFIAKVVDPPTAPEIASIRKVKQRVCNRMQHDQELALLNTHPAGVKDRDSFFKYDMLNNMSPIGKINLAQHTSGKERAVNTRVQLIELGNNKVSKAKCAVGSKEAPIPVCDDSPKTQQLDLRHPSSQIISPLSLTARQSELAKNIDALYNGMLPYALKQVHLPRPSIPGNNIPADKNITPIIVEDLEIDDAANSEVNDALIIIRAKETLKLPINPNKSFPVTEQDVKHYNAIIEVAFTKSLQKRYALIYPRVHCNYVSLGQSLMLGGHIDTFLVPCFCRKLFEESHPSRSGRHHFFPLIGECILNYKKTEKLKTIATSFLGAASASRKKRLDLSDTLFFPLCQGGHWIVFAVDFQHGLFAFLDSLYDKDSHFHITIREQLIGNFINLWELIFNTQEHNLLSFKRMYPHVPRQENVDDCGVFGMKIMEIWNPLIDLRKVFSADDITHIRIQYMIQLYFWGKNTADKSLVNGFQFEGVFVDNEA